MAKKPERPGIAKTRELPFVRTRSLELLQSSDYRWRELFEAADVVSEGASRDEPGGARYYGSTSVLLPFVSQGGRIPDEQGEELRRLAASDPHARVRAVRVACLEAQLRAGRPMGCVHAELFARVDARGVRIDVDVEAPLATERVARAASSESARPRRSSARRPSPKR